MQKSRLLGNRAIYAGFRAGSAREIIRQAIALVGGVAQDRSSEFIGAIGRNDIGGLLRIAVRRFDDHLIHIRRLYAFERQGFGQAVAARNGDRKLQ
jgi:hypothetical protein